MALFDEKKKPMETTLPDLPTPPSFSPTVPQSSMTDTLTSPAPSAPSFGVPPSPLPDISVPSPPSESRDEEKDHSELMTEDIEKIAESLIEEKWSKVKEEINSLSSWKEDISKQVDDFKTQMDALDKKLSDTQNAMMGKIEDYNKSMGDVNVEIQAMGKVFEKIIPTFTENVNKLSDLVGKRTVEKIEKPVKED